MAAQTIFSASTNVEISSADMENFFRSLGMPDGKILDIGCRTGELVAFLSDGKRSVTGIDLDASCIKAAEEKSPHLKDSFFVLDILEIDTYFKEKFDHVYCIGVMNYLPCRLWPVALQKMQNVLSDKGNIIVTFTNPSLLAPFIGLLRFIPQRIYAKYLAPVITTLLYPLQDRLLANSVSREHFHYKFTLSLYGLNLGFPAGLEKYRINVEHTSIISNKTAVFCIPAGSCLD